MHRVPISNARLFGVIFAVIVLASAGALPLLSMVTMVNAQSTSTSCPASDTLHMTEYSGVPTTFNEISAYNPAGYFVADMAYLSAGAALRGVDGTVYNYTTVFDSTTHNANYTVWTFHIRSTAMWSNGQPVTSQDVKDQYSPNFALNPNFDPTFPALHSEVVSITTPTPSTVVFNLNATDAHLDQRIGRILDSEPLYPSSFTTTSQGATFNGFGTSIGSGPFYIDNYQAGQSTLTMLRNPYYTPQPTVCKIVINFVENIAQTPTYLASGATDLAFIPSGAAATLSALPNVKVITQAGELITYIEYNQTQYPYNMTAFRQALVYGINQSAISSIAYNGLSTPAYTGEAGVPSWDSIYNPAQKQYSYNPTEAMTLLNSIGITKGTDGYLHYSNGTRVSTTLWVDNDIYSDAEAAPLVLGNLRSLGFNVNLQEIPWNTMVGYGFKNSFNMDNGIFMHTSNALYPGDPYVASYPVNFVWAAFWMPVAPELVPNSANAQYNSNFSAISATDNPTLMQQYCNNIQALTAEYLPVIPLAYDGNVMAYNTQHFSGWPNSPNGYMWPVQGFWNQTALVSLKPVTPVTSTTSTVTVTGQGSTTTVTGQGATTTVTGQGVTQTVTAQAAANNTLSIALGVVAIVVIIAIVAIALSRRKPAVAKT